MKVIVSHTGELWEGLVNALGLGGVVGVNREMLTRGV